MQRKLYTLAEKAKIGMVSEPRLQEFAELVIEECITAIKETPRHCAYTTYDSGVVECTIQKAVETVKNHFKED